MSDPLSALAGARYAGLATIEEAGLQGMITLRGDLKEDTCAAELPPLESLREAARAAGVTGGLLDRAGLRRR